MMKCDLCHQDWVDVWHTWWEQNWAPYRNMLRSDHHLTLQMTSLKEGYDGCLRNNRQLWVNKDLGRDDDMYEQYEGAIVDYWEEAKSLLDEACIQARYMDDPNQPLHLSYEGDTSGAVVVDLILSIMAAAAGLVLTILGLAAPALALIPRVASRMATRAVAMARAACPMARAAAFPVAAMAMVVAAVIARAGLSREN